MQKKRKDLVKNITLTGVMAALYVVFVLLFGDLSFGFTGFISFRVAEILIPLCCFDKKFIPGAILGCFVANLFGGQAIDIIFGTFQSTLTVFALYYIKNKYIALLVGSLICGVIIGTELMALGFSTIGYWIIFTTFIGETFILFLGYLIAKKCFFSLNSKIIGKK